MPKPTLLLLTPLIALLACGDPGGGEEEALVPTWALVEELRIGSLDDEDQALTWIEPHGLAVGPDGQVYVAQRRTAEVRVYDSAGGLVRVIGRRGRGPGEFSHLVAIGFLGDTLYAVERTPGRVSRFTAAGEHLSTTEVAYPPPTPFHSPTPPLRLFPDGTGVLSPSTLSEAYARGEVESTGFVRVDRLGQRIRELFSFSEPEGLYMAPAAGGVLALDHPMPEFPLVAFAEDGSRMAVVERTVGAVDGARFGITELTLDGDTLHATRVAYRPVPVPAEVADSIRGHITEFATRVLGAEGERLVRGALRLPRHYPPVTRAVYARDGSLWLRREDGRIRENARIREDGREAVDRWEIYVDGARIARVELPAGLEVHAVHDGAVWGVEVDDFDVPYVVRYRILP